MDGSPSHISSKYCVRYRSVDGFSLVHHAHPPTHVLDSAGEPGSCFAFLDAGCRAKVLIPSRLWSAVFVVWVRVRDI